MSQGDSKEAEKERRRERDWERDVLPDAGPPPDSHWPTGRGRDDGESLPRPRAEPAAPRAAGLSGGEEAAADEKTEHGAENIQSRVALVRLCDEQM